jgi:hypothetical protein
LPQFVVLALPSAKAPISKPGFTVHVQVKPTKNSFKSHKTRNLDEGFCIKPLDHSIWSKTSPLDAPNLKEIEPHVQISTSRALGVYLANQRFLAGVFNLPESNTRRRRHAGRSPVAGTPLTGRSMPSPLSPVVPLSKTQVKMCISLSTGRSLKNWDFAPSRPRQPFVAAAMKARVFGSEILHSVASATLLVVAATPFFRFFFYFSAIFAYFPHIFAYFINKSIKILLNTQKYMQSHKTLYFLSGTHLEVSQG